jgi:hypothetical protein
MLPLAFLLIFQSSTPARPRPLRPRWSPLLLLFLPWFLFRPLCCAKRVTPWFLAPMRVLLPTLLVRLHATCAALTTLRWVSVSRAVPANRISVLTVTLSSLSALRTLLWFLYVLSTIAPWCGGSVGLMGSLFSNVPLPSANLFLLISWSLVHL